MIDVTVVVLSALWFTRRILVPFPALVILGVGLTGIVYSIGALRAASAEHFLATGAQRGLLSLEVLRRVDFQGAASRSVDSAPDLRNAGHLIAYTESTERFTLGAGTWNRIVFQYIPGQIVGYDVKESFMIDIDNIDAVYHRYQNGTTLTGLGSAYQEAGYLGAVVFFLIGYWLRWMWQRAIRGDVWMQGMYASSVGLVLISFTHSHVSLIASSPVFIGAIVSARILADHPNRLTTRCSRSGRELIVETEGIKRG